MSSSKSSSSRGLLAVLLALALPLALVGGLVVWWNGGVGPLVGRERCVVQGPNGSVELDTEQMAHASTIAAVAMDQGLPSRAVTVGLATAMQESKLYNLPGGDHDSAGLFQQRPSQGWGSVDQVTDPVYAAQAFFGALLQVQQWQTLPVTKAAQEVQRSAYPDAYAKHADEARILTAALTGRRPAAVSCTVRAESEKPQKLGETGLTPRAAKLRTAMESAWGTQSLGGFAPGGVQRPNPSAHNEGRAMDVFFEPYRDAQSRHDGWAMAHWMVANADALDVSVIIYRDQIWSARRSPEGWRDYVSPFGDPNETKSDPTLRHLDHIHVEVS
jgi:hypothetical protein